MTDKRGQVSIFVVIALVIIGVLILFFAFRGGFGGEEIPSELLPVFDFYQSCINYETQNAVQIAGEQGGYIIVTDYVPGSEYAPFSSHLNFLGSPVPYWYYISANGVIKEQVPSKEEMERQIAQYIQEGMRRCDFESFNRQGFLVQRKEAAVNVDIQDNKVVAEVNSDLEVSRENNRAIKNLHKVEVETKLGKFYNLAREIYEEEKQKAFLEEYALDVLYLYAPVDGAEIQCGPKIWSTVNVIRDLRDGLEANIQTIKFKGGDYDVEDDGEYFIVDKSVDENVRAFYSRDWPTKIEISGDGIDEDIMIAEAIGTQQGLGVMGFCYVPYHFVYDVSFPVLIQIYDNDELFQFPVVAVIDKNVPREAVFSELSEEEEFDLCEFPTQKIQVDLFDVNLNRVNGNVSYECFSQRCRLGETKGGRFSGFAPACVNGFLHVRANGFADKRQLMSTNIETFTEVILDRESEVKVDLEVGGTPLRGTAVASFVKDNGDSVTAALPGFDEIKLSEGTYEVKVYVYGNSSVVIPATTKTQCTDVPKGGLLGFFGGTKEKCFDISVPETKIEHALIGGGKADTYLLDSELRKGRLTLKVDRLPTPNSIDMLSQNFEVFETKGVGFEFHEI